MRHIRIALRTLFRTPVVTTIALVSLALGIGANTAVFSIFNEVLLRPLPVADAAALVNLSSPGQKSGSVSCVSAGTCDEVFSYPMFRDLERASLDAFTAMAAHLPFSANLSVDGQTKTGNGSYVSGGYFSVLELRPALGRLITTDDDRAAGESPVVVLSHDYWVSQFGASRDVLGRTLLVSGQAVAIVGVAPEGFTGTTLGSGPEVYLPITMRSRIEAPFNDFENRRSYWVYVFARRKPGVSIAQAGVTLNGVYQAIVTNVEVPLQTNVSAEQLAAFKARPLIVADGSRGQSNVRSNVALPFTLLFAVAGVVLLIACANIANLLLARAASRATEIAVRVSVGASRAQIVRQLLLESCLLAVMGGLLGATAAVVTIRLVVASLAAPGGASLAHLDPRVFGFAAILSLGTGLLFGLFPALHATRHSLMASLKDHAAHSSGTRAAARFRTSMVVAQMTLSTLLLVATGLCIKSLVNVSRAELGIKIDHLVTFSLQPRLNGYTPEATRDLFERAEAALAATPGVASVGVATIPMIGGGFTQTRVNVDGFTGPAEARVAVFTEVGPHLFETTGIALEDGRDFTEGDTAGAPKVAIVNDAFAKKFGLGRAVVGKHMTAQGSDLEIVGLVANAKYSQVKEDFQPEYFTPYRQDARLRSATFYIRTPLDPEAMLHAIPSAIAALDRNLPVQSLRTMEDQVRQNTSGDRLVTQLAGAFATLATLLAAIGLYGVLAYTVTLRAREFGVRMALGATPAQVCRLVLRHVVRVAGIGAVIGAAAALGAGRVLQSQLYHTTGYDPAVFAAAVAVLSLVALAAGALPAWRASQLDPMQALRAD